MRHLLLAAIFCFVGCGEHKKNHKPAPVCEECKCDACECDLDGNCECKACECEHNQPEGDGSGGGSDNDDHPGGGDHCPGGHC